VARQHCGHRWRPRLELATFFLDFLTKRFDRPRKVVNQSYQTEEASSISFVIRVKGCIKVRRGRWVKLNRLRLVANVSHCDLGRI